MSYRPDRERQSVRGPREHHTSGTWWRPDCLQHLPPASALENFR